MKSFSFRKKTEGNKDFLIIAKLKVIPGKPSVLCYKKSKQKENRTEGNKGTRYIYLVVVCTLTMHGKKCTRSMAIYLEV